MLQRRTGRILMILLVFSLLSACTTPINENGEIEVVEETAAVPIPVVTPPPPFVGVWFPQDHSSMLVITEETIYLHEFGAWREVYARIDTYDLENQTIDAFISAILSGGMSMGYDSPNAQIAYQVNGNELELVINPLDLLPDDADPIIYYYDEFLN